MGAKKKMSKDTRYGFFMYVAACLSIVIPGCNRNSSRGNSALRVDTIITNIFDYTGGGVTDTSTLHITGEDFSSPFSWTYDLRSGGQTIIYREGSDSDWDSLFNERGFEDDSSSYIVGKKKFFFQELGLYRLQTKDYSDSGIVAFMVDPRTSVTYRFLRDSCGFGDSDAVVFIDSVASKIMDHTAVLTTFIESPTSNEPVMIYVDKLKRFVPVYED